MSYRDTISYNEISTRSRSGDESMSTLYKTHSGEGVARETVQSVAAPRTSPTTIPPLTDPSLRDVRREPVGGFAGPVAPNAPVGSFGNVRRRRWQGKGAFAGDPDRQRQGSFGDVDRDGHGKANRQPAPAA
jgi:hypothetical protein